LLYLVEADLFIEFLVLLAYSFDQDAEVEFFLKFVLDAHDFLLVGFGEVVVDELSVLLDVLQVDIRIAFHLHEFDSLHEVDALLAVGVRDDLLCEKGATLRAELSNWIVWSRSLLPERM
jgi:hypothetical protein